MPSLQRVYTNDIIRKSPKYDTLCLPWMRRVEAEEWASFLKLEERMRERYGDKWLQEWQSEVAHQLQLIVEQVRGPLPELPDCAYECPEDKSPEEMYRHHQ